MFKDESLVLKYEMSTITMDGRVFSHGFYKTRQSMRRAKERYNLKYGAHLGSKVTEHLKDGSKQIGVCCA